MGFEWGALEAFEGQQDAAFERRPDWAEVLERSIENLEKAREQAEGEEDALLSRCIQNLEGFRQKQDIELAAKAWEPQLESHSCAVSCQGFIIREYTGRPVKQESLLAEAKMENWYDPEGSSMEHVGKLLCAYGIEYEAGFEADYEDLKAASDRGERMIVAVQNRALLTPGLDEMPDLSANHAVEVIRVDDSDPRDVRIILNDPGSREGRAMNVSLANFLDAWKTGDNYLLVARRPGEDL